MKNSWTLGLDDQHTEEMRREFEASALLRSRLRQILDTKIETARVAIRTKQKYENPSWAYEQADHIGFERALYEIYSLLSEKSV